MKFIGFNNGERYDVELTMDQARSMLQKKFDEDPNIVEYNELKLADGRLIFTVKDKRKIIAQLQEKKKDLEA